MAILTMIYLRLGRRLTLAMPPMRTSNMPMARPSYASIRMPSDTASVRVAKQGLFRPRIRARRRIEQLVYAGKVEVEDGQAKISAKKPRGASRPVGRAVAHGIDMGR